MERYMKRATIILATICFQLAHAGPVSRDVLVPDEATAITIAKAVLIPIFGEDFEKKRMHPTSRNPHTFYAILSGDTWVVEDAPPSRKKWSDLILRVEIDRKCGCIGRVGEY
jgi:hypothetical protein